MWGLEKSLTNFLKKQIRNYTQEGLEFPVVVREYFDFQTACLSQFEFETKLRRELVTIVI